MRASHGGAGTLTRNSSYSDSEYEYRHVQLPKAMLKAIPKDYHDAAHGTLKLLWEDEWRAIGITQVRHDGSKRVHEGEMADQTSRATESRLGALRSP